MDINQLKSDSGMLSLETGVAFPVVHDPTYLTG